MERTYCLGLYEKSMPDFLTIREKLEEAGKAGFDFLELSIDETDARLARLDWNSTEISKINRHQLDTGIPIRSFCLSGHRRFPLGHPDEAVRAKGLEIMCKAIDLASKLGVRIIQIAGYDIYYGESTDESRAFFAQGLRSSVEYAAKKSVILAFETMETEFLDTVEKAMGWIESINSPYLQVYPDSGNIKNASLLYNTDVLEDLEKGRGHLAALHLKESIPGHYREIPYGMGHVDFAAMTACAMKLGVRVYLAEFWHKGEENWRRILADNCRFLRERLDAAQ